MIPWNDKYLIGTTDIRYEGDLDNVQISSDEIDYLLRETNRVFPIAKLAREQILYTYSGVRPLPFTDDKDEQGITRRHFIRVHPKLPGLFSIVGGKLTTYRSLAEETVNLVLEMPQLHLARSANCATAHQPLPGAATSNFDSFCASFKKHSYLPQATTERWLQIYGTRASQLLDLIEQDASLSEAFDSETGALAAEIVFAFRNELATSLADCLLRRTMVGLNSSCGLTAINAAGAIAQKYLDWSRERVASEIDFYRKEVARKFSANPARL